ncbi:hypothetical protein BASA61_007657 [Batrachochytrium salamandrivorans]|nr:hypothetical protein BASA61_007657 [Batrachochytrium salamandrivorans]KAH9246356.1 hypothetical protein BASA81_016094 [Batrachochytrium salamandrivorans]
MAHQPVLTSIATPDPTSTAAALKMVYLEFRTSLMDLTFNSKPIITNLTIIAQESIHAAPAVVRAVEERIKNAPPKNKIPTIYLMDSIMKNVGEVYRTLFSKNIISVFSDAYAAVEQADQMRLQKLVHTWVAYPSGPIFPPTTLSLIERLCSKIRATPHSTSASSKASVTVSKTTAPVVSGVKRPIQGSTVVPARVKSPKRVTPPSSKYPSPTPPASAAPISVNQIPYTSPPQLPVLGVPAASSGPLTLGRNGAATILIQQQIGSLLQQKRTMALLTPNDAANTQQIQVLDQLLAVILSTPLDTHTINQISMQIQAMMLPIQLGNPVSSGISRLPSFSQAPIVPSGVVPVVSVLPPSYQAVRPPTPSFSAGPRSTSPFTLPGMTPVQSHSQPYLQPQQQQQQQHYPMGNPTSQIDLELLSQLVASGSLSGSLSGNIDPSMLKLPRNNDPPTLTPPSDGFYSKNTFPPSFPPPSHNGGFGNAHLAQPQPPQNMMPPPRTPFTAMSLPTKPTLSISLSQKDIQSSHPNAIYSLYDGLPLQCKQCALRFAKLPNGDQRMAAHLDWHFRQNRRLRESSKRALSRDWYSGVSGWIDEQYGQGQDKQAVISVFGDTEVNKKAQPPQAVVPTLPADGHQDPKCVVCCESFEKFFDEDGDMWMLRDAIQVEDKMFHQGCLEQDSSSQLEAVSGADMAGKRKLEGENNPAFQTQPIAGLKKAKV